MPKRQSSKTIKKENESKKPKLVENKENLTETEENNSDSMKALNKYEKIFDWTKLFAGYTVSTSNEKSLDYTLKIVSMNVNGIRAWLKNDGSSYFNEELADIFVIQELKCSKLKLPSEARFKSYESHYNCADREGYSGTAVYSKIKPMSINFGLGIKKHDNEGRVITLEFEKFFLINTYVPNSGRALERLGYRTKEWNKDFAEYLESLDKKKPIILTGDLNVSHKEIDIANPKSNLRSAGFTIEEREGMDYLLDKVKLVDTFRHLYPDRVAYTYWNYMRASRSKNVGWRLDYFLVSKRIVDSVIDQEIRCGVSGSDHCPLALYLKF